MKEQSYPEGLYKKVTIKLTFDPKTECYEIVCPEWQYETSSVNPAHLVLDLVREITQHNKAELEADLSKNFYEKSNQRVCSVCGKPISTTIIRQCKNCVKKRAGL